MKPPVFGRRSSRREGEGEVTPFPITPRADVAAAASAAPAELPAAVPQGEANPVDVLRIKLQSIFLQQVDISILARLPRADLADRKSVV